MGLNIKNHGGRKSRRRDGRSSGEEDQILGYASTNTMNYLKAAFWDYPQFTEEDNAPVLSAGAERHLFILLADGQVPGIRPGRGYLEIFCDRRNCRATVN